MAIATVMAILFFLAVLQGANSQFIEYNTTQRIIPGKINVHLVPHSHDDVGWLKTVDQYYVGANNSIRVLPLLFHFFPFIFFHSVFESLGVSSQGACVQNVLDSVMSSLFEDRNRKFIYVEMVSSYTFFFS